ncbi:hypothetical protein [Psychrilyobacter atlanticus]|uniref:hypothetical protein n=1 Tax=Psychrilyobacter atlanticus TaxID=271091 RepID=UPI0003FA1C37|nr:hypothetical protein [Psychrilyobacter atlanticus]
MDEKKSQLFLDLITQYLTGNYSFLDNYKITYYLDNKKVGTISALEYIKNFHLNGKVRVSYSIEIKRK